MGKGGRERAAPTDGQAEVMATDFHWAEADEPHAARRKAILAAHPEIKELYGTDPNAAWKIAAVVAAQVALAVLLRRAPWALILVLSYAVGAFANQNLLLAIHELSHNLALPRPYQNKLLGLLANLPVGVPTAVTFQKYHLEHHTSLGIEGVDLDVPSPMEGRYVTNTLAKLLWVSLQLFFYALRPLLLNPKPPGAWEALNAAAQLAFDAALVAGCGSWRPLAYLLLSTFVGGGLHPMAGHFIAEHYVFAAGQETYSYYGPLNALAWHVGYHNEHHDFPRVPGSRLHRVREIAPEFYDHLHSYDSWTMVIVKYITDPAIGPFSRVLRKRKGGKAL